MVFFAIIKLTTQRRKAYGEVVKYYCGFLHRKIKAIIISSVFSVISCILYTVKKEFGITITLTLISVVILMIMGIAVYERGSTIMKRKIISAAILILALCMPYAVLADDIAGDAYVRDTGKPPVVVDKNFDTDCQNFLSDETVAKVKVFVPEIDNKEIVFKSGVPFLDKHSRIRVPLRDIAEQLGYNVHWYAETGQIVVSSDDDWYTFSAQDNIVVCKPVNIGYDSGGITGHMVMDCCPVIIDGVTYIPLRHISNILFHNVV